MMNKFNKIGLFTFIVAVVMAAISMIALSEIIKDENTQHPIGRTRGGVDQQTLENYKTQEEKKTPFDWNQLTAAMVGMFVFGATIINRISTNKTDAFREEFNDFKKTQLVFKDEVMDYFKIIVDSKDKRVIEIRIGDIIYIASGLVADDKLKLLIEGIGQRVISFARDTITHQFGRDQLERAFNKINVKLHESRMQVNGFGLPEDKVARIAEARERATEMLRVDLQGLAKDHVFNDKYERFGDILCAFIRSYLNDIISIYNE